MICVNSNLFWIDRFQISFPFETSSEILMNTNKKQKTITGNHLNQPKQLVKTRKKIIEMCLSARFALVSVAVSFSWTRHTNVSRCNCVHTCGFSTYVYAIYIFLYPWACEKYARFVQLSFIYLITWTSWLPFHMKTTVKNNNTTICANHMWRDHSMVLRCTCNKLLRSNFNCVFIVFFYSKALNARHFNQCRSTPGFSIYFNFIIESVSKLRGNCLHSFSFHAYSILMTITPIEWILN